MADYLVDKNVTYGPLSTNHAKVVSIGLSPGKLELNIQYDGHGNARKTAKLPFTDAPDIEKIIESLKSVAEKLKDPSTPVTLLLYNAQPVGIRLE